jgi:superfamily II DNA or RNA helicase
MESVEKDEKELRMLYNFLPIYPEFDEEVGEILGETYIESGNPNFNIYRKKEFYDNRLENIEFKPENPGQLMKHQVIITRFLSSNTPYNGILLMHEPGTGKTCSSVGAIEKIKNEMNEYDGALILMRGSNLINNYINELVFVCTCQEQDENRKCIKSPYMPENYYDENITDEQRKRRINSEIKKFYDFETFGVFSKRISKMKKDLIIKKYSNKIIVIDETHNLRMSDDDEKQYNIIHEFLHTVKNCKILLLTGTPMVDKPEEIASIMNLILPLNRQLPVQDIFAKEFLKRKEDNKNISILRKGKVDELKNYLHGYVSYLKAMKSQVKKTYVGDLDLGIFNLYPLKMSSFQSDVYEPLYIADKESSEKTGVYNNSIQSSLFVFPDKSYGSEGFERYVETKRIKSRIKDTERSVFSLKMALRDEIIKGTENNKERLERLRKYSVIYADCIEKLINPNDKKNHFIYVKLVKGSGAILFSKLLDLFGFRESKGGFNKGLHYSIMTNSTTTDKENLDILKTFNSPSNIDGKYIKVIIGSRVISEGITFKNVQNIHIFTPSWNFSETDQAIARGYRLFSHLDLEKAGIDVDVNIFLYCAIPNDGDPNNSIDYQMYNVSKDKDISIKSVEKAIKEASFDCALNKNRNTFPDSMDGSRECNYKSCNYVCDGVDNEYIDNIDDNDLDISTYNLYYNGDEINKIINIILDIFDEYNIIFIKIANLFQIASGKMMSIHKISLSYYMMFDAIIKMSSNNMTMVDRLGYNSFFRFDNNMLYITHNLKKNTNFFDSYYVENFPLQKEIDLSVFNDKVDDLYYKTIPKLFNSLKNEQDKEKRIEILHKFPLDTQEFLLETAVLSEELAVGNVDLRNFLLEEFRPFIIRMEDENIIVSTLTDNLRCLNIEDIKESVWEDCSEENKTKIKEKREEKKTEYRENPYGYYGLLDKFTDKFSIVDIIAEKDKIRLTKSGKVDTRRTRKGKACDPSWKHKELLILIDKIKLDYPDDFTKKFSKKSESDLNNEYDNDKYKEIAKTFTIEEFKNMKKEDKLRVMYWGSSGKESVPKAKICTAIQKWFKDNNLLEEYISEKTKKK